MTSPDPLEPVTPETGDPDTDAVMLAATVATAAGATIVGCFAAKELTRRKDEEKECCR